MSMSPQPAALKLLHGRADGRDSGGRPVAQPPAFRRIAPKPPTWLSREAKAEWKRVAPGLARLDLVKEEDRATFATYCETWARFVSATRALHKEGHTIENRSKRKDGTEAVWVTKNPNVTIAETAANQLRAYAREFGLTPSSEQQLGRVGDDGGDDDNNPFA